MKIVTSEDEKNAIQTLCESGWLKEHDAAMMKKGFEAAVNHLRIALAELTDESIITPKAVEIIKEMRSKNGN